MNRYLLSILVLLLVSACNPGGGDDDLNSFNNSVNNDNLLDKDHDGYAPATGDCDDTDPDINPSAVEVPDGVDNNCNGFIDDDYDNDGYGVATDCNDNDATINPMVLENCSDGIDNNCNGYIDMEEPDDDGDGYSECEGDCDDGNAMRGLGAIEDPTDGIDNDCDGLVDEVDEPCDCARDEATLALTNMGSSPQNIERALGICNSNVFVESTQVLYAQSFGILSYDELNYTSGADGWGDIRPIAPRIVSEGDPELPVSCQALVLFTGQAWDSDPQSSMDSNLGMECPFDPVTQIDNAEPDDVSSICHDLTQVRMVLRVPGNVTGIAFDFLYLSSEYPEWVDSEFNDTFYAIVGEDTNDATHINVSFDGNGKAITINNNYFEDPSSLSQSISGTGYENDGSATGWLTTKAPVEPNSIIEVIFSIHDEGDGIYDSAVVIDNFRWTTVPIDGPITVE